MNPRALTFDCAGTLIQVRWDPIRLAIDCAVHLGYGFDSNRASQAYQRMLHARWPGYIALNQLRSESACDLFWRELTAAWVFEVGMPGSAVDPLVDLANRRLFGPDSTEFTLYADTVPALEQLQTAGYRMAVISNWDVTLHKALRMFELDRFFETAIASLEEGVEKPDARIFQIALERLGVEASEVVHVGDNPLDDLQGARNAGLRGVLIDREQAGSHSTSIRSLLDLPKVL